jgi:hypothetical protein
MDWAAATFMDGRTGMGLALMGIVREEYGLIHNKISKCKYKRPYLDRYSLIEKDLLVT